LNYRPVHTRTHTPSDLPTLPTLPYPPPTAPCLPPPSRLRVLGVAGLRVADCSVMPTVPSGNTNVPAIMLGERAADIILEDARAAGAGTASRL
jgi:hypothetical protein